MSNTVRRHPRTMQEAFGPYTSNVLTEQSTKTNWGEVRIFVVLALVVFLVISCSGFL